MAPHNIYTLPFTPRQVLENIQRQSSEGLALPFLANWLAGQSMHDTYASHLNTKVRLGDISNLLGCILTHQLPFQVGI